jgi:hypothetical protein
VPHLNVSPIAKRNIDRTREYPARDFVTERISAGIDRDSIIEWKDERNRSDKSIWNCFKKKNI